MVNKKEWESLKRGFILSIIITISLLSFCMGVSKISLGAYSGGPQAGIDIGINSRATSRENLQPGSSGVFIIRFGTESVTGVGTATGYMNGTDTAYPRMEWTPALGTINFIGVGSHAATLQMNGLPVALAGSLSGYIVTSNGAGSNTTLENPNFTGVGTISATLSANSANISPTELSYLDGLGGNINTFQTTHQHGGTDSIQISHNNVTGTATKSHTEIDTHINTQHVNAIVGSTGVSVNQSTGTITVVNIGVTALLSGGGITFDNSSGTVTAIVTGSSTAAGWDNSVSTIIKLADANTNVGIGVATPTSKLEVSGTIKANLIQSDISSIGSSTINILTIGTTTQSGRLHVVGTSTLENLMITGSNTSYVFYATGTARLLAHANTTSTTFTDSSVNAYTMTSLDNAIGTTTSKFGSGAIYLDGTGVVNDHGTAVRVGTIGNWDYFHLASGVASKFTIDCWVRFFNTTGIHRIIGTCQDAGGNIGFLLNNEDGAIRFGLKGGTSSIDFSGGSITADGSFHNIRISYDGTTAICRLFVDGIFIASDIETGTPNTGNSSFNLLIGAYPFGASIAGGQWLYGNIDEVIMLEGLAIPNTSVNFSVETGEWNQSIVDNVGSFSGSQINFIHKESSRTPFFCFGTNTDLIKMSGSPTFFFNGTITANNHLLVGTSIFLSTATSYIAQFNGAILASTYNILPCDTKHKTTLAGNPESEALAILGQTKTHKYLWNNSVPLEQVITKAKKDFEKEQLQTEYALWKDVNLYKYNIAGTITATIRQKMKTDFEMYYSNLQKVSFEDLPDRDSRIIVGTNQIETDSRNNTANYGIMIDDGCPQEILDCNGLPDITKWTGFNTVAIKALLEKAKQQQAEIEWLKARLP